MLAKQLFLHGFAIVLPSEADRFSRYRRCGQVWFSWLLLLFLIATSLPLLAEMWMERNLKVACERFFKQMFTLSPRLGARFQMLLSQEDKREEVKPW